MMGSTNVCGGLEFHHGTGNHVMCGKAVFTTHDLSSGRRVTNTYQLFMHPDGWEIQKRVPKDERKSPDQEWDTIKRYAQREDVLALLPTDQMQWTWQLFMLAVTFYGYGDEDGAHRTQLEWERAEDERLKGK